MCCCFTNAIEGCLHWNTVQAPQGSKGSSSTGQGTVKGVRMKS